MIVILRGFFAAIFIFMIVATVRASLAQNLFEGGAQMLRTPWGWMTLFDAYFAFLTFYLWVAYKETSTLARLGWFVAMLLGNIAMAFYVLRELFVLPRDASIEALLVRREVTR